MKSETPESAPAPAGAESARQRFTRHLESHGMLKTPERYAILERAVDMKSHFSADSLHLRMEEEGFHVSRSSVYNTLELLCHCGILCRHQFGTNGASYEIAHGSHCHLLCTRCGRIEEVESRALRLSIDSLDTGDFRPAYFSATVYGLCGRCAAETGDSDIDNHT